MGNFGEKENEEKFLVADHFQLLVLVPATDRRRCARAPFFSFFINKLRTNNEIILSTKNENKTRLTKLNEMLENFFDFD